MLYEQLREQFVEYYGDGGEIRLFFAPGRVNLIGDHTDYSGGHVFPCAISEGITMAVRVRDDNVFRFACTQEGKKRDEAISMDQIPEFRSGTGWLNNPIGVIDILLKAGYQLPHGLDMLFAGDLPIGAGLSSSSALAVLMALAAREIYGLSGIDTAGLAQIARNTDNQYCGGARGIMDPLACAVGKENCGIFLSVDKMRYEYVPMDLKGARLVVTLSGVDYAKKEKFEPLFGMCGKALKRLQSVTNIQNLCSLSWDKFESCKDVIMDEDATRLARHAIYEDMRTIRSVSALRVGNIRRFGQMMNESHISLRDNCHVTCEEIDFLVEQAWKTPGVIGSRMTGAGFGGSTVSIVEGEAVDEFRERIGSAYRDKFGIEAEFLVTNASDGAREII